MEILVAIQIVRALAGVIEDGIPLGQKAIEALRASDEPEAKAALAALKAFYEQTGIDADDALAARIAALKAGRTS